MESVVFGTVAAKNLESCLIGILKIHSRQCSLQSSQWKQGNVLVFFWHWCFFFLPQKATECWVKGASCTVEKLHSSEDPALGEPPHALSVIQIVMLCIIMGCHWHPSSQGSLQMVFPPCSRVAARLYQPSLLLPVATSALVFYLKDRNCPRWSLHISKYQMSFKSLRSRCIPMLIC